MLKKNTERLLLLLLTIISVVCATLAFTACNGSNGGNGETTDNPDQQQTDNENNNPDSDSTEIVDLNLTFTLSDDGKSYIVSADSSYEYDYVYNIVIPSTYNNLPVTEIADNAFSSYHFAVSVTIPDGITVIGNYAFYSCLFSSAIMPDSVTTIGDYAFCCYYLQSIIIPDSVTSIGEGAFECCTSLTSVYYNGTADEWSNISGTNFISATIYYYAENGSIMVAGNYWYYDNAGNIKTWSI